MNHDKTQEALRLALEALELHGQQYPHMVKGYCLDAITAIREALVEQPAQQPTQQQEPVAYSYTSRITGAQGFSHHPMPRFIDSESWDIKPLYDHPPASKPWVGLTANEHEKLRWQALEEDAGYTQLIKATETKLREKNHG